MVWDAEAPRGLNVVGQHWPTFLITNFWDPPILLPQDRTLGRTVAWQRDAKSWLVDIGTFRQEENVEERSKTFQTYPKLYWIY